MVTLADIEIASLERVQFGLKQFDLVLVFKDFTRAPLHINSIPSMQLDDVKNWLECVLISAARAQNLTACSSVDIPLAEGPVNLNWGPIMKTINDSPYEFFRGGGWTFLGGTGDEVGAPSIPCAIFLHSVLFRANRTKRPKLSLSSKQSLCRRQARRLLLSRVSKTTSMPVKTKEADLTLMMKAKVRCSNCGYDIANDSHYYFQGEDWDELERKAAKCKTNFVL